MITYQSQVTYNRPTQDLPHHAGLTTAPLNFVGRRCAHAVVNSTAAAAPRAASWQKQRYLGLA